MKQLHPIQLGILKKLLFTNQARYTDIKPSPQIENNQFQFHLESLVNRGYVNKTGDGYQLSVRGKEYAGRIDTEGEVKIIRQAKIGAFVCPIRKTSDNQTEVLMYTRLKQPFYGSQGFMSGKIEYGESIIDGAKRELFEETGLTGEPEIVAIKHYLVSNDKNEIIEDKLIFWCRAMNPTGNLKANNEGDFYWININDIDQKITKPFETIDVVHAQIKTYLEFNGVITFEELLQTTSDF